MRTYDDLSAKEKKKFDAYLKSRIIFTKRFYTFYLISIIFLSISIILLSIDSLSTFLFGIFSMSVSLFYIFLAYYTYIDETKWSFLIFNIESSNDIFDITEDDKKELKRKWHKVK
jgi:hypothetical protein